MKNLQEYLNKSVILEDNHGLDEYKQVAKDIEENIDELETYLNKLFGVKIKLSVSATPKGIKIESDNLVSKLKDKMWSCLFDKLQFITWGGNFNKDGLIWFNPKLSWHYSGGGSNGTDATGILDILFNPESKEWIIK